MSHSAHDGSGTDSRGELKMRFSETRKGFYLGCREKAAHARVRTLLARKTVNLARNAAALIGLIFRGAYLFRAS